MRWITHFYTNEINDYTNTNTNNDDDDDDDDDDDVHEAVESRWEPLRAVDSVSWKIGYNNSILLTKA